MMPQKKNIIPQVTRLGNYLQQLRDELGVSLRYVARTCTLSPGHLSKIESGKLCPGIEVLVRISQFYSVPLVAILREAGFIQRVEEELPPLEHYLRQRYHLPPQAIRDIQTIKELCDRKYPPASAINPVQREEMKGAKALKLPFLGS